MSNYHVTHATGCRVRLTIVVAFDVGASVYRAIGALIRIGTQATGFVRGGIQVARSSVLTRGDVLAYVISEEVYVRVELSSKPSSYVVNSYTVNRYLIKSYVIDDYNA